ncbi:hypothetical protein F4818DRAFT_253806 [Hypoxylon cercidicola]|nr:hypothetical protein F4818DRAFT_253806 [Hypoxylon cercidicola]
MVSPHSASILYLRVWIKTYTTSPGQLHFPSALTSLSRSTLSLSTCSPWTAHHSRKAILTFTGVWKASNTSPSTSTHLWNNGSQQGGRLRVGEEKLKKGRRSFRFFDMVGKGVGTVFETTALSDDWVDLALVWYPGPRTDLRGSKSLMLPAWLVRHY